MEEYGIPRSHTAGPELEVLAQINESTNHQEKEKDNEFTTSKNVKLKIQKVSAFIISEACGQVEYPEVPKVFIQEDDRWEENPSDPVFLQKWQAARLLEGTTSTNVMIGLGTYCDRLWCPPEVPYVDSEELAEILEFAGIPMPKTRLSRYVAWLKYVVLCDNTELQAVVSKVAKYSGLAKEVDVQEAMESFPDSEERGSDNTALDTTQDTNEYNN